MGRPAVPQRKPREVKVGGTPSKPYVRSKPFKQSLLDYMEQQKDEDTRSQNTRTRSTGETDDYGPVSPPEQGVRRRRRRVGGIMPATFRKPPTDA